MKNILLMGLPGVGKTTVILNLVRFLGQEAGGFYTTEIREGRERQGFEIVTLQGKRGILAHKNIKSDFRVSKYGVNIKDLEEIGVAAIEEALSNKKYVIIDEIGKMELYSPKFKEAILRALESEKRVVATIKEKGNGFSDSIKARKDTLLLEVTFKNRDKLADQIMKLLKSPG